jgi:chaperonin GroES
MPVVLTPLGKNVLVRRDDPKQKIGNILLPDTAKDPPLRGTVLAVGPGKRKDDGSRLPLEVDVGSRVYFDKYHCQEVDVAGEKLVMVDGEDGIIGVLSGE